MLVYNAHQARSVKIAALSQFLNKDRGMSFRKFKSQKTTPKFVGKQFRTTNDVEEIAHRVAIIRAMPGAQ